MRQGPTLEIHRVIWLLGSQAVTREECHRSITFFHVLSRSSLFPSFYPENWMIVFRQDKRHSFEGLAPQRRCWRVCRNCRTTEKSSLKVCSTKGLIWSSVWAPSSHWSGKFRTSVPLQMWCLVFWSWMLQSWCLCGSPFMASSVMVQQC